MQFRPPELGKERGAGGNQEPLPITHGRRNRGVVLYSQTTTLRQSKPQRYPGGAEREVADPGRRVSSGLSGDIGSTRMRDRDLTCASLPCGSRTDHFEMRPGSTPIPGSSHAGFTLVPSLDNAEAGQIAWRYRSPRSEKRYLSRATCNPVLSTENGRQLTTAIDLYKKTSSSASALASANRGDRFQRSGGAVSSRRCDQLTLRRIRLLLLAQSADRSGVRV